MEDDPLPQIERARRATQRFWDTLGDQWGLLTGDEVRDLLRSWSFDTSDAEALRAAGELLGVRLQHGYRYPGFQFDRHAHRIYPWVRPLLDLARELGRTPEGVALWMLSPTTYLGLDRNCPVDHLSELDLLVDLARKTWTVDW